VLASLGDVCVGFWAARRPGRRPRQSQRCYRSRFRRLGRRPIRSLSCLK
jgi:hypothetical protein